MRMEKQICDLVSYTTAASGFTFNLILWLMGKKKIPGRKRKR